MSNMPGKKRIGLISRIIWLLNVILAVALLAAYLSSYVDPGTSTIFAFLGLGYLFLMVANLLFMLYWLIRGRKRLLLSLLVLLIGYQPFVHHLQILPGREVPSEGTTKLLSFNVQNMAHSNLGVEETEIRSDIYNFIGSQQADISCIQEFADRSNDFKGVFKEMRTLTHYDYCYYNNYRPQNKNRIYALVILSQFPAINTNTLALPGEQHQFGLYADMVLQGDTVRVYNLHLASIRLRHEDYQFVEDISKGQTEKGEFRRGSSNILRKLHSAYKIRSRQTAVVERSLSDCPYPVIICGDFNDTPLSYCYHRISDGLNDAFVKAGHGLGNTFSGKLPPIRIDFILYSGDFNAYEFKVHRIDLSDHYPVSVFLSNN